MSIETYKQFSEKPDHMELLIRTSWKISEFPEKSFNECLRQVSGTEYDDFQVMLKKDVLWKTGLALIGIQSPDAVLNVLKEQADLDDRLEAIVVNKDVLTVPSAGFYAKLSEDTETEWQKAGAERGCFVYLLAETALLLTCSRSFLNQWSGDFMRLLSRSNTPHPTPKLAIQNLLRNAMRGDSMVQDEIGHAYRTFKNAKDLFLQLMDPDGEYNENQIWEAKRDRLLTILRRS